MALVIRVHAEHTATAFVEIAHDIAGVFIVYRDLHRNDRLKENRDASIKPFLNAWIAAVLNAISEESTG